MSGSSEPESVAASQGGAGQMVGQVRIHLLGVFVALHLFAVTLMALPSPGSGLNRQAWSDPTVKAEFQGWVDRLNGWGVEIGYDEFEDKLWTLASGVQSARGRLLAPFDPYYRYCGTWQSWKMFVAPHRFPGRLVVEVITNGKTQEIYRARSDESDWRRHWFDHDRMRASAFRYSWRHFGRTRKEFAQFLAEQAASDFPEASHLQVVYERYKTPSPADVQAGNQPKIRRDLLTRVRIPR